MRYLHNTKLTLVLFDRNDNLAIFSAFGHFAKAEVELTVLLVLKNKINDSSK